ncbi:hypothetical protein JCM11251_006641 [Rhodosporidiobolus azoricus]
MSPTTPSHSLVILDDYQGASQQFADWSSLSHLPTTILRDPVPPSELISTLLPYTIIHANRERTKLPRAVLEQLPNLNFIATTGHRNRGIDLVAAKELGIAVSGTGRESGHTSTGTVEQTWALILALSRRIRPEHESVRQGGWQTGVATGLRGKTLGIIGLGNLGTEVATVGRAFGMKVQGWSPNLTQERADKARVGFAPTLEELLKTSDVVSIHIVSSNSTRGLLGPKELSYLRPSAILINTSRGPIIDEAALLDVLQRGAIQGAGLDVFDEEPLAPGHPVRTLDNVVLSPHMGYVEDNSYGLPPPHSFNLARQCESILRDQSVVPATIAILNGRIKIGLTEGELEGLAEKGWKSRGDKTVEMWKVGRREIGAAVVKGVDGGTTVSGTMAIAHLANCGIKVFSTGGIGGVHRGAETSFDISSDLQSFSDTPIAVVCAGSKSILDIGLTLEYLEAHAVPVAAYKTSAWPAFYTADSGFKAPMRLDSAEEVAKTIRMAERLSLPSSLCLGNPIPEEYHAVGEELQLAVVQAVKESVENGMSKRGKEVTPWLLQRVNELTKGKSLESNKVLIENNVRVGGEVALAYAKLLKDEQSGPTSSGSFMPSPSSSRLLAPIASTLSSQARSTTSSASPDSAAPSSPLAPLVVTGSLAVDITMTPTSSPHATTSPGSVSLTLGGVAGNVAGAAHSLLSGEDVLLIAPIGKDLLGEVAKGGLRQRGMRSDGLIEVTPGEGVESRSATCGILMDEKGELVGGVADMAITAALDGEKVLLLYPQFYDSIVLTAISEQVVNRIKAAKPRLVCFDANLSQAGMADVLKYCEKEGIATFFEPTSNAKSLSLLKALQSPALASLLPLEKSPVSLSAPNTYELAHLFDHVAFAEHEAFSYPDWLSAITVRADDLALRLPKWVVEEGVAVQAVRLLPIFNTLFVKSGERGVLVVQRVSGVEAVAAWKKEAKRKGTVVALSGATSSEAIVLRHYPALPLEEAHQGNVTGAGDNLAGAVIAAVVRGWNPASPRDLDRIVDLAQRAAIGALKSKEAVGDHTALRELLLKTEE